MRVTSELLAAKVTDYLQKRINIAQLVDWAENMVMDADYDEQNFDTIREIIAYLGVADVKEFGLSWDNCNDFLNRLDYQVEVRVSKVH